MAMTQVILHGQLAEEFPTAGSPAGRAIYRFDLSTPAEAAHADDATLASQLITAPAGFALLLENVADAAARDAENAAAAAPVLSRRMTSAAAQCRAAANLIRGRTAAGRHVADADVAEIAAAMAAAGVALECAYT